MVGCCVFWLDTPLFNEVCLSAWLKVCLDGMRAFHTALEEA